MFKIYLHVFWFITWYNSLKKKIEFLMYVHSYAVKQNFDLEEYSLSQSTLEQVGHF